MLSHGPCYINLNLRGGWCSCPFGQLSLISSIYFSSRLDFLIPQPSREINIMEILLEVKLVWLDMQSKLKINVIFCVLA